MPIRGIIACMLTCVFDVSSYYERAQVEALHLYLYYAYVMRLVRYVMRLVRYGAGGGAAYISTHVMRLVRYVMPICGLGLNTQHMRSLHVHVCLLLCLL